MLPTKLLKLRLTRIAKGSDHLSTQDKLMLVSMESPDLSANFFLRLFKMSLPKQWDFQHETEEDIVYSSQLIKLIEDEFISAYESHARKHAWYEQCLRYQLNFIVQQPTKSQLNTYLRQLEKCLDQPAKIDLLTYFQQHYPSPQHALALAKSYAGAQQYTSAIQYYEWAFSQATQRNEVAFYGYINCLLNRNQAEYQPYVSDAAYAVDLLCKFEKLIKQKTYIKTLQRAVSLALPPMVLQTQVTETNILTDMGRGLNSLGKSLGSLWGGRDAHIPYNKDVINHAPQLLSHTIICTSLLEAERLQDALQRLLIDTEYPMGSSAQLLVNLWQQMQDQPDILKILATPNQHKQLVEQLVALKPIDETQLDLGQIDTILEQGILPYLGELRINKQHPQRHELYEQREVIVKEMTEFAIWFQQMVLKPYLEKQIKQLQYIQPLLIGVFNEITLTSVLFAYQFEIKQRAQDLFDWIQQKLEKGNSFEQMQVAWVALREISGLNIQEAQERIQHIEKALQLYKEIRLRQIQLTPQEHEETVPQDDHVEEQNENSTTHLNP